jgi:carbonic anhydrase
MFNSNSFPSLLPSYLIERYKKWKNKDYKTKKKLFETLYKDGQTPHSLLIGCSDSRVNMLEIFKANPGELFIHRHIAALVPKYNKNNLCALLATLEYAVYFLEVKNILVVGHSRCGGVKNYFCNFNKKKEIVDKKYKGLNSWLNSMKPLGKELKGDPNEYNYEMLEKKTVLLSIQNLISYPFIDDYIKNKKLVICGLWHNIKTGDLEVYNVKNKKFEQV